MKKIGALIILSVLLFVILLYPEAIEKAIQAIVDFFTYATSSPE